MKLVVDESNQGKRLDLFISEHEDLEISRSYVKNLVEDGQIKVNDKLSKASYKLRLADVVEVIVPEPQVIDIEAENIPLEVVFEDEHLMVINKPINMITHPSSGQYSGTLVNAVLYHVQKNKSGLSDINGVLRPGIVHRLDKDTSGLILVAKSNLAHKSLAQQIQDRSCKRVYHCLVHSNLKNDKGMVNRPIGRHPKERLRMHSFDSLDQSPNARLATTHYRVLERYNFHSKNFTLVECSLDTGRTHQIRVHMSWLRNPIVGDTTYGAPEKSPIASSRPLLLSKKLSFTHPISQESLYFELSYPDDFQRVLDFLKLNISQ